MCKGSSSSSTIDSRVWDLLSQNTAHAKAVANQPYQPYTGQLRAGMNANQNAAGNFLTDGLMNAGAGAIDSGIGAAKGATGYRAPAIDAPVFGTIANAAPGMMGTPAQAQAPISDFASATAANPGNSYNYNPRMMEAAHAGQPAQASFANANTAQANAAHINRGDIQNLTAQTGLGNIAQYMNPYTQNVVDATLGDLNRSRQMAIAQGAGNATLAGAFGGSRHGVADSLTNQDFLNTAASTAAQLRSAGFNNAAGLLQNDQDRALQAGTANQAADLSVAGQNAGFGQQTNLFNAGALNDTSRFNASNALQNNQFNAGAANDMARFNAGNQQAANAQNQSQYNEAARFNNQLATDQENLRGQWQQQVNLANAQNALQNNQYNAGNSLQAALANAGALNDAAQFNAGNQQAANLYNSGQANTIGLANQDAALKAALANQQASLADQGINLQGAGLLGTLGNDQFQNYLSGANAINQFGTQQQQHEQAQLDALYQQYLRELNYPVEMQGLLNQSLGLFPNGATKDPSQGPIGATQNIISGISSAAGLLGLI